MRACACWSLVGRSFVGMLFFLGGGGMSFPSRRADRRLAPPNRPNTPNPNPTTTTRRELETVGLRLNKRPPNIYFKKKKEGGIKFNATVPLTKARGLVSIAAGSVYVHAHGFLCQAIHPIV